MERCESPADADSVTDAQAKPGFYLGPPLHHPRDSHRILSQESAQVHITRDVTWRHVPTPAPHFLRPLKAENADTVVEGRGCTSIPGGSGDDASDGDDDLEVAWEVDSAEGIRDVGVAAHTPGGNRRRQSRLEVRSGRERVPHPLPR